MKKTLFILFTTLFIGTVIFAQAPQGLKYQAIIRDAGGAILQNKTIGLQISILKGSEIGSSVYTETWSVSTNNFGLVNLNIGVGEGNSTDDFSAITWGTDNYWLKVALDKNGGTNYTEMGTSKLLSVPYALYSEAPWVSSDDTIYYKTGNVGIGTSHPNAKLEVQSAGNDTLFCVKDALGRPVFIVFPDGAQVIVDTSSTKSGASGRFLISGRGISKTGKGTEMNFLDLTKKNYLIGNNVASGLIPSGSQGIKNSILGYEAGYSLTTGYQNTFIGYQAGHNSIGGNSNIFIGNNAGYHSEKGIGSVNIGYYAGYSNNNDPGSNVFIGRASGSNNINGSENVYIGYNVGQIGSIGTNNVYLGANAGRANSGVGNVFVGSNVGNTYPTTVTISNKLYIDNSNTTTPLIWGDFTNDSLKVYGSFNINNAYTFPKVDGISGQVLRTDGSGKLTWENAAKSSAKSKELILLKKTVRDQQSELEELIKENKKIQKENKNFESRLKVLENIINK